MDSLNENNRLYYRLIEDRCKDFNGFMLKELIITRNAFEVVFVLDENEYKISLEKFFGVYRKNVLPVGVYSYEEVGSRWERDFFHSDNYIDCYLVLYTLMLDYWKNIYKEDKKFNIFLVSSSVNNELTELMKTLSPKQSQPQVLEVIKKSYKHTIHYGVEEILLGCIIDSTINVDAFNEAKNILQNLLDDFKLIVAKDNLESHFIKKVVVTEYLQYNIGFRLADDYKSVKIELFEFGENLTKKEEKKEFNLNDLHHAKKWLYSLEKENELLYLFEPPLNHANALLSNIGFGFIFHIEKIKSGLKDLSDNFDSWQKLDYEFKLLLEDAPGNVVVVERKKMKNKSYEKVKIEGNSFDLFMEKWFYDDGFVYDADLSWEWIQ